jgi:hypothetical protein
MVKVLAVFVLLVFLVPSSSREAQELFAIDISRSTAAEVSALRSAPGVEWWIELGDVLVIEAASAWRNTTFPHVEVTPVEGLAEGERLYVSRRLHANDVAASPAPRFLASSGPISLVAAHPEVAATLAGDAHVAIEPAERGRAYARGSRTGRRRATKAGGSAVADAVDADRWLATVRALAELRTRVTGSPGALAARDLIAAEFTALGLGPQVQAFKVNGNDAFNVIAEIPGSTRPDDVYVVCAHYDSISERSADLAPGAEDNGTGAAGVLELARVFVEHRPAATIRFVAFSGEEQGLVGSFEYVNKLRANGQLSRVKGAINMDMIGFTRDADLDVLLESGANGVALVSALEASAAEHTDLRVVTSFDPFGSDHVPFIQNGVPAVLTIENDWDQYPGYHRTSDTIDNVVAEMGRGILRMNAAALAVLTGVGGDPAAITSVRYVRKAAGPRLIVDGRFAWQTSRIEVDGQRLETTQFKEKHRDGVQALRVVGADPRLSTIVPKGVPVLVRVVDTATGATTEEFSFTR